MTSIFIAYKYAQKPGTVGFPLPDVKVKIDSKDNKEEGEILVKTPTIMLGYYKNEEATKEAIVDGWFHTGDIGYIDKEGYITITGRKKDMIVLKNGKKIFPEEIDGVENVKVSLENKNAILETNSDVSDKTIKDAVDETGYKVTEIK